MVLEMGEKGLKFLAFFYVFMGINNCQGVTAKMAAGRGPAPKAE